MSELPFFSKRELLNYDGEQSPRILVAYQGIVYDVTDCPKWRNGLHEGQHFPGQNLTQELDLEAPHSTEVFEHPCVKKAGIMLE